MEGVNQMKKSRKFLILVTLAVVILLGTATTAFAASKSCTLHASNTGDVNSAGITSTASHYAAYNYLSSTDYMIA
jgi:hypothetical protein